ncbi:fumarylacetoacetase [Nocardiopsis coralliicola]
MPASRLHLPQDSLYGPDNLPYGVFSPAGAAPRVGVRYGDHVVDLTVLLQGSGVGTDVFAAGSLNPFMAQGHARWTEVRAAIRERIRGEVPDEAVHALGDVTLHLPFEVGDYVDFYASEHHATNLGRLFRPDSAPLMPNWKHLPVGYHGRGGSVVVSGTDIVRPNGQRKAPDAAAPDFGPSRRLDIEAELGFVIGTGSPLGTPVSTADFATRVFGAVLVNDWSARDIQAWEYVPLGPHLGKSFATSVAAWVVPLAALSEARVPTPVQDPEPLPYLQESAPWGLDIDLSVVWNGQEITRPPYAQMYWSPAQMLAHLTANGASTRTGDLYASGTISGPEPETVGAFIELTRNGREPVKVAGEERTFLADGDEVAITATAPGASGRIGFGEVRGRVLPAR